ncbi:hypothetical protein V8E55_005297 [Tylopilus felleus]
MSANQFVSLFGGIYGSLYFAAVSSTAFYGIACMQTYENDPMRTKVFVAALWAINTINEALIVAGVWRYIMAGLVNPLSFMIGIPELIVFSYIEYTSVGPDIRVLFPFTHNHSVSGKNVVTPLIWVFLSLVQIVLVAHALYSSNGLHTAYAHFLPVYSVHAVEISVLAGNPDITLATLCFSASAGMDILIAIFMTLLLLRERASAELASEYGHLDSHVRYLHPYHGSFVIGGPSLRSFLIGTEQLYAFRSNFIYTAFSFPLGSIYYNTVLGNLNARAYLRGDDTTNNVDLDLFRHSTSRVANTTQRNRWRRQRMLVFSTHRGVWQSTDLRFSDGNQSTPAQNV